jgi:hypothetical protein
MGQEIQKTQFNKQDFQTFTEHLKQETELLSQWFYDDNFHSSETTVGFEMEGCLADINFLPSCTNDVILKELNHPQIVPELAKFNIEINSLPYELSNSVLTNLQNELNSLWSKCENSANKFDIHLIMTGILPSLSRSDLILSNMSAMSRFRALNEQVMRCRRGNAIHFTLNGKNDKLSFEHENLMLEAFTTSFQLHIKVQPDNAVRFYNASLIASAPLVALAANSPFLQGNDLWAETRIPIFEQAVGLSDTLSSQDRLRCGFGSGFAKFSLFEVFKENLLSFKPLLPIKFENDVSVLSHLLLHNGTVWRWNRPIIGFEEDGKPHLRIEHRAIPAGPTPVDSIANGAFFFGLCSYFVSLDTGLEESMSFIDVRDNFYQAARQGLDATLKWEGDIISVKTLLLDYLIPFATVGLKDKGIVEDDINFYMDILRQRVQLVKNGCTWQRHYMRHVKRDVKRLTQAYLFHQKQGKPVHLW